MSDQGDAAGLISDFISDESVPEEIRDCLRALQRDYSNLLEEKDALQAALDKAYERVHELETNQEQLLERLMRLETLIVTALEKAD